MAAPCEQVGLSASWPKLNNHDTLPAIFVRTCEAVGSASFVCTCKVAGLVRGRGDGALKNRWMSLLRVGELVFATASGVAGDVGAPLPPLLSDTLLLPGIGFKPSTFELCFTFAYKCARLMFEYIN